MEGNNKKIIEDKIKDNRTRDYYKNIYHIIQNQIKDYVINKLLLKINKQNNIIKELSETNEIIKQNFLCLLKKILINENILKNNTLSTMRHSSSPTIKGSETFRYLSTDYNSLYNQKIKNLNLENNISKTYKNLLNNGKNKVSFILKKNIRLNEDIFVHRLNHKNKSGYFNDNQLSTSLITNQSQRILPTYKMLKKNSSERNNNNYSKISLKVNSNLLTPNKKQSNKEQNYIPNTDVKNKKEKKKLKLEEQKNLDKGDYKIKIRKNTYSHRSGFITNKI